MSDHPDQSQWTQTIPSTNCYSNAKEEAFCFVFQHFTILIAVSLLCAHPKRVARTDFCFTFQIAILVNFIYIFFSTLRKY